MDSLYHDQWARAIVEGRTFQEGPYFRAPLYPWFLAGLYKLFGGSYLAARMAQGMVGSLSCGLLYALGRLMFSRGVALAAGLAAAMYWLLIAFDAELLIPVIIVFLDIVVILLLEWGRRRDRPAIWLFAGVTLGLSAIAWPLVLLFAPTVAVWLLAIYRGRWKRGAAAVALFAAGCCGPILPVTVLNWQSGDRVLIATQGGVNFYIGNNPKSDGFTAIVPGTRENWWGGYYDAIAQAEAAMGRKLKASEVSDYYYRQGLRFWREEPGTALAKLGTKLMYFWTRHEIANNKDDRFVAERFAPFVRYLPLGFWIVGPLGALGLLLTLGHPLRYYPLWGFVIVSMAGVVMFFVTGRYRVPVLPALILLSSFAIFWLVQSVRDRQWKAVSVAGLVLGLISSVVAWTPAGSQPHAAEMLISMGRVLVEAGRTDEAAAYFEEALQIEPENPRVLHAAAQMAEGRGRRAQAIDLYRRSIARQPGYAEAENNLGSLLFDQLDFAEALSHFVAALAAQPGHASALINRGRALEALGRMDEALQSYRQGLALDDRNMNGWSRAIRLSGRMGLSKQALELAERAAAISQRQDPWILTLLAEAQFGAGRCDQALATINEAHAAAQSSGDAALRNETDERRRSLMERCRQR